MSLLLWQERGLLRAATLLLLALTCAAQDNSAPQLALRGGELDAPNCIAYESGRPDRGCTGGRGAGRAVGNQSYRSGYAIMRHGARMGCHR